MNEGSIAYQQASIEELLEAIHSLLNQSCVQDDSGYGGTPITTPTRAPSVFVETLTFGADCRHSRKDGILPTPSKREVIEQMSPGLLPRMAVPKFAASVPVWEQQAPFNSMALPDVFKLLDPEDEECVICVKKIHKLGFRSVKYLRHYFSQFGTISKIVILPSRQKDPSSISSYYGGKTHCGSVRPASMGFLVMASKWSAGRILSQEMHQIGECPVETSRFNRQAISKSPMRSPSIASVETHCPIYPLTTHL